MTNNLKAVVYGRLEAIANAEKITRVELGAMSRELLMYVPESNDIDIVNRLLGVLTPVNRRTAILFFKHFLPWDQERDTDGNFVRFGSKAKGEKKVVKKMKAITEFLSDEGNTIWTWSDENIEIEQKEVSLTAVLEAALDQAINGVDTKTKHAEPLTVQQIIDTVLTKVTADDMLEAMTHAQERVDEMAKELEINF